MNDIVVSASLWARFQFQVISIEFLESPTNRNKKGGHIQAMQRHDVVRLISNISCECMEMRDLK